MRDSLKKELQERINNGESSRDVAMSLDVSPSTVRRWAKTLGYTFKAKSVWRKQ